MSIAICIENLSKNYGELRALKGVTLDIEKGSFFGLLGPNGAGKSTLINILAGLTRAQAGSVTVLGHDVVRHYRQARRLVGIVPQELVFDPFFTVREVLRIQAGYFGLGRSSAAWIDEILEALNLSHKADTNMRALSGGMKRRVLIGQALVHKPPVVVLDEPTAGVDVELRQTLWRFIRRLHSEGHTIVLTTHYLEEAQELCERIGILHHGSLIALDDTASLLKKNMGGHRRYTLVFDTSPTTLPEELAPIIIDSDDTKMTLQLDDRHTIGDVLEVLQRYQARITDIQTETVDLEDVFLKLTTAESA